MNDYNKTSGKSKKPAQTPVQQEPQDRVFLELWHAIKDIQRRIDELETPVQGKTT